MGNDISRRSFFLSSIGILYGIPFLLESSDHGYKLINILKKQADLFYKTDLCRDYYKKISSNILNYDNFIPLINKRNSIINQSLSSGKMHRWDLREKYKENGMSDLAVQFYNAKTTNKYEKSLAMIISAECLHETSEFESSSAILTECYKNFPHLFFKYRLGWNYLMNTENIVRQKLNMLELPHVPDGFIKKIENYNKPVASELRQYAESSLEMFKFASSNFDSESIRLGKYVFNLLA